MSGTLPPLPVTYKDGSDWLSALDDGWRAVPQWGRDGWDLLEWPYAAVAHFDGDGVHGLAVYEEGDVTVQPFASREQRDTATDRIAVSYWRRNGRGPADLLEDNEPAPHQLGPFSLERLEQEAGA